MGCRPAKFSKVTDSIVTYSNGTKITSLKEKTNQANDGTNSDQDIIATEIDGTEEQNNAKNSMITNNRKDNSRMARRANRRIGTTKEVSIFQNVPSIVLERSKSQIDFFIRLEEKINKGEITDQNEGMELESL